MPVTPPIRLARRRDSRPVARLSRDLVEHGLRWRYDPRAIRGAIANPSMNVVVAGEGDAVTGFGIMEYGDTAAHLVLLGVCPEHRGCGLGRRLVTWLERPALVAGIRRVRVEVRADNPGGLAFYAALGYRQRARVAGYYEGRLDALQLDKALGVATSPR
ncbi:MAG: GNAT family N-acetyltransferase [Halofilum sp. (in: g-proteobacteria)]|nr:GNAT family N-acetyltransferase [Halofilum sp. (in: g-proteobacteria)]